MKKRISFSKLKLVNILEETVEEVRFTPEQYLILLRSVYFQAHLIPRMSKYKNKKIVVTGSLDLTKFADQKMLVDLGPIKIEGNLNISNTNIKSLDNTEITGYKTFWNTPYEKVVERRRRQAKYDEQKERRENDEWNPENTDDEGLRANAAFLYALDRGDIETLTDEERERIKEIDEEIQRLEEEQENLDAGEEDYSEKFDEITDQQSELEEEKDELISEKVDVYDFYPAYGHYNMDSFECLENGHTYAVGTRYEADKSLEDYFEEQVDSPQHYFSKEYLTNYIDGDALAENWEDTVRDWVYEEPDSYGVEKQLSKDQKDEIWVLEMEKYIYENTGVRFPIQHATKEDGGVFDFEDEEGNRFQYYNEGGNWVLDKDGVRVDPNKIYDDEDTQDHQDDRESRISDIEWEIENIKDDPNGDPSDEDIEEAVEDYLDGIRRRPYDWVEEMGLDIYDYVDKESLLEDLVNGVDWGEALSSYDGEYDLIDVGGEEFVVMRIE